MSNAPPGKQLSPADRFAPANWAVAADSSDLLSDLWAAAIQEQFHAQLHGLQQWICELLIKNQQLRMALVEMNAKGVGDDNAHKR